MSDDKKEQEFDLDSILSEINSSIKKEVSKTDDIKQKKKSKVDMSKPTAPKSATSKAPKPTGENPPVPKTPVPKTPVPKTTKMPKSPVSNPPVPKQVKPAKPASDVKSHIDSAFAKSAKIIEDAVETDDDTYVNHAVRFISVTASEVVENSDILSNAKDIQRARELRETTFNKNVTISEPIDTPTDESGVSSPISLDFAPKVAPAPDIAIDQNHHIQKIRKKHNRPKMSKRQKTTAIIGIFMTCFIVIGAVAAVWASSNLTYNAITKSSYKKELAQEIFPFVIIDIPEFEEPKTLDNSAIISAAIWSFIINQTDKSMYQHDDLGMVFVPDVEIEPHIRRLFGNDVTIKHQSVDNVSIMMIYDPATKMYSIEATPRILPYRPRVDKVSSKKDIYTLEVSYVLPDAMWNMETDVSNERVDKVMKYVLKKNKDSYQVMSVKIISVNGAFSSAPPSSALIDDQDVIASLEEAQQAPVIPSELPDSSTQESSSDSSES